MPEKEMNKVWKKSVLKWAHKYVWDEILEELAEDCPNRESCDEAAIENYEPMHNEGFD